MKLLTTFKKKINKEHYPLFLFNTNTLLDIITGSYEPGKDGYILNGGLFIATAIVGKQQTFKSNETLSYLIRALSLYPHSEAIVYDTEFAINKVKRIMDLAGDLPLPSNIEDRILLVDKTKYDLDTFYEFLLEIREEKLKHINDYIVESPFIDPDTKKPYRIIIPTFVCIDSLSAMQSAEEIKTLSSSRLSSKDTNTVYMQDGKNKSLFMRNIPYIVSKSGIYFMWTAHLGKTTQMNPMEVVQRELQHMQYGIKPKSVGSQFLYLNPTLLETRKATSLMSSNKKESLYPLPNYDNPLELNEILTVLCRCKNDMSGIVIPFVVSSYTGIQNGLTCYRMLSELEQGITGNPRSKKIGLLPDLSINRKNIREYIEKNYKVKRALEILAEYEITRKNAGHFKLSIFGKYLNIDTNKLCELLLNSKSIKIDDILNSRGYWTYDKNEKRPYMNITHILELLKDEIK